MKQLVETESAPQAIGCYSQAIRAGNTVYLSGQIGLDPKTMTLVTGDVTLEIKQVFENLKQVALACNSQLDAVVKLTVYLADIADLAKVNEIMPSFFSKPYPARTSFQVAALPKNARVEVDAILVV